jgi:hypothetical protein
MEVCVTQLCEQFNDNFMHTSKNLASEISSFHGSEYIDYGLLGYDAM